jgi:hypothetical protein
MARHRSWPYWYGAAWALGCAYGLATPAQNATLRCATDADKTLQRWHMFYDEVTRAVSRDSTALNHWDTTPRANTHHASRAPATVPPQGLPHVADLIRI